MFPTSLRGLGHSTSQSKPALPEDLFAISSAGGAGRPPSSGSSSTFLGSVLKSPDLKAWLASPLHGCGHLLQDGGEHPASSTRVTVLCALRCQRVLPRRSGWAGAERMEQAWGRRRGASPGACISAEQPGGRANKYQTFSGEINYPPTARENSRDKLSC